MIDPNFQREIELLLLRWGQEALCLLQISVKGGIRKGRRQRVGCASYQFIASQLPLLPCFVILELDPINTSPLPDGTMCQ